MLLLMMLLLMMMLLMMMLLLVVVVMMMMMMTSMRVTARRVGLAPPVISLGLVVAAARGGDIDGLREIEARKQVRLEHVVGGRLGKAVVAAADGVGFDQGQGFELGIDLGAELGDALLFGHGGDAAAERGVALPGGEMDALGALHDAGV